MSLETHCGLQTHYDKGFYPYSSEGEIYMPNTIYATHLYRGSVLFAQNDIIGAIREFSKAIELDNTTIVPYQWRILCYISMLDGSNNDKKTVEKIISDLEDSLPLARTLLADIS